MNLYDGDYISEDLRNFPEDDADLINEFLNELVASERSMKTLLRYTGKNDCPDFNVKVIEFAAQSGYNIARIRPLGWPLSKYRIIYGLDNQKDDFYLLAIVEKNITETYSDDTYNYESNHPISRRVLTEYDHYRIPRIQGRR